MEASQPISSFSVDDSPNDGDGNSPPVSGGRRRSDNVLIVGAGGYIGGFVARACIDSSRNTFILCRPHASNPPHSPSRIQSLEDSGARVIHGSLDDVERMTKILRELCIEIVISAVGGATILDQLPLIDAILAAGTVRRFLPSEFGHDIDKANPVEPALTFYKEKRKVRRAVEAAGIPYTYICCNSIAGWPYFDQRHPSEIPPPTDHFGIYGDGYVKAYFVAGKDIGKFTMMAADDEQTLNKSVHFRPETNFVTLNEFASQWEKKIGKELPRVFISEDELLGIAKEHRIPASIVAALTHDIFINGCQYGFEIDGDDDVEVSSLYPETPLISLSECLDDYLAPESKQQLLSVSTN